ncbi:MAG: DEDD exonuclease domain-containing protein [Ilumatobacter sp.]|nr:DEDD exonuclease domain-containing protein [Ilumatobacter sp.]
MPVGSAVQGEWQRSFDDLGRPLHDVTFCVIDLETTGGNRTEDMITEVGAVKVRGGECIGTFQTLVNPGRAIPPKITILTGLSDALVQSAPRIEAVLPSLLEFIGDAVIVGHNVGFDVAFIRNALERSGRPRLEATIVDTVALARRLVRDEVPNCRLGTLASRLRLDHQPSHRALDDALATTDLLHVLIERASGLGVLGLDDLLALAKLAGHPQAGKLKMTADLPRSPGVYMFCGHQGQVLYVGKASNLRQRVRSYFGSEDRRKVGPMLRETQTVRHLELPDPLTAEVIEQRLIARLLPRYNRRGTRANGYCYIRLDVDAPWPRLAVVKQPSAKGIHLGPLPSRTMAHLVVEAIQSAVPLRRCSERLGRNYVATLDAPVCSAAQLGVAQCPCSGTADVAAYADAVEVARRTLTGDPAIVVDRLHERMARLAAQQRFEEAASMRDRLSTLLGAIKRHRLVETLRAAERAEVTVGDSTWIVEHARLVDVTRVGIAGRSLPVAPPDEPAPGAPLASDTVDEALVLARFFERRAGGASVVCTGDWDFPVAVSDRVPHLPRAAPEVHRQAS